MSLPRRIKRLVKGYLKSPVEQLEELEAQLEARRELEQYLDPTAGSEPVSSDVTVAVPQQTPATQPEQQVSPLSVPSDLHAHYRLLGLPSNADLRQVQQAYEDLMARANPQRFPEGSAERRRAEQLAARIQQAYDAIRRHLDPTSARFDNLEI